MTVLHVYTFDSIPLRSQAFMPLLELATTRIQQHISNGGSKYANHWLDVEDDPMVFQNQDSTAPMGDAAWFYAQSEVNEHGVQQHLTYGTVNNVIKGLKQWVTEGPEWFGCWFEIEEGRWGKVGKGMVLPGELPAMGTVNASEKGELTWFKGFNMTALVKALETE